MPFAIVQTINDRISLFSSSCDFSGKDLTSKSICGNFVNLVNMSGIEEDRLKRRDDDSLLFL